LCAVEFQIDRCLTQLRSQLVLTNASSFKKLNRISSFQAPMKRANMLNINITPTPDPNENNSHSKPNPYNNHLHIPQPIFSQILQNNELISTNPERDIDDMNSVVMDENDIGTTPISENKEDDIDDDNNLEESQSSPQLNIKKSKQYGNNKNKLMLKTKSNSSDSLFVYGSTDAAGDSNNSMHKSMSVAELCSDLNITNTV